MNKREFMVGGCVALAATTAAAVPASSRSAAGAVLRRQRLPDLATDVSGHSWQAYIGHTFEAAAAGAGAQVSLTLREVSPRARDDAMAEQFILVFDTRDTKTLPAATHVLVHSSGQRVPIYLDHAAAPGTVPHTYRAAFGLLT